MEELSEALSSLSIGVNEEKVDDEIEKSLNVIKKSLTSEDADKRFAVEKLLRNGVVEIFSGILKSREKFQISSVALAAEILAEVAKIDIGRKQCSDVSLLIPVLDLLSSSDSELLLQACRALANICYDNDIARSLVKEHNGIERLIQLLRNLLEKENVPNNLRTATSGCLLNLTDTYEELQEQALQAGILDVVLQYLSKFVLDKDVVTHCLLVLTCLSDSENGRDRLLENSVLSSLLSLFEKPLSEDVIDSLLDLFGNLSENDSAKLRLAEMGLCEKLVQLVKKHLEDDSKTGDDNPKIYKTVPDLVILVLTGDASMEHIYQDGQGLVYKETLSWLKCKNENLHIAGALAAGNFARKDSHCIQMLKDGVAEQLLFLLQKHSGKDGDIRMQHAVLSALRNLAIPAQNKVAMMKLGIVDNLVEMMNIETFPVVFKLLGTLRMLIDKQEDVANKIGENLPFVQRLVEWCDTDDHPGVKGEATRLLAWLTKNSSLQTVMKNLVIGNALPPVIAMMKSVHAVMQNEALIAVRLIASCSLGDVEEICEATDLINSVHFVLTSNSNVSEVTQNALMLITVLTKSEKFKSTLKASNLPMTLRLLSDHGDNEIREMIKSVLLLLDQ